MPSIGSTGVTFTKVAREWRCKYSIGAGGPGESASLTALQVLLTEYLVELKALPSAEVTRIVCGGCGDFKVVVNQPAAEHGTWQGLNFSPEADFLAKMKAIEGVSAVEAQEYTCEAL